MATINRYGIAITQELKALSQYVAAFPPKQILNRCNVDISLEIARLRKRYPKSYLRTEATQ